MNLTTTLSTIGKTTADIVKIYHGKDHACRCGCCGRYFEPGELGFKRAMNAILKDSFTPLEPFTEVIDKWGSIWKSDGLEVNDDYVNIPYDRDHDKCYTLYFV